MCARVISVALFVALHELSFQKTISIGAASSGKERVAGLMGSWGAALNRTVRIQKPRTDAGLDVVAMGGLEPPTLAL